MKKTTPLPWVTFVGLAAVLAVESGLFPERWSMRSDSIDSPEQLALAPSPDQTQALRSPYRPFEPEKEPEQVVAPKPPPPPPSLSLLAVVRDGDRRLALLDPGRRAPAQAIEVGEEIQGWQVESIGQYHVALRRGERLIELRLGPETSIASRPNSATSRRSRQR
jgi:hypothetical protein